jgi:hypothetical protein
MKQQQANADNPQQPNALPTQQKAVGMAQQQPNATNPQAAHLQQPHATQQPLTPQQMRLQRQNVGYLAKNSAVTKKCEWGRQTMHKWLVGCLYIWYTFHRNWFVTHKKLGCGFLAHS